MHRFRSWTLDPPEWRTQRNRLLPAEGGDGSTLSLDFTTGVLDPRLTFTRLSNATFINSSGLVEWANANMYWNTAFEGLSGTNPTLGAGTGWSYAGFAGNIGSAVFNGDGTVTITTSGSERRAIQRSSGFSGNGLRVIASVEVTIHSGSLQASQVMVTGTPTNAQHYVNGTAWNVSHPSWNGGILPVGTQFTFSYATDCITGGTTSIYFGVGCSSAIAGSATFSNPRWTMWKGSGTVPYYPNTSATNNSTANYFKSNDYQAPRFDYDPTAIGTQRGLLIEGSANNLARYSETLETTGGFWGYNAATRTVESSDINPTGGTGSISFGPTTNGGSRYCGLFLTGQTTTVAYTYSVWVKAKGTSSLVVTIQNSAGAVNSNARIISQPSGANASFTGSGGGFPQINNLSATGWTRIELTTTATLGGTGALNVFMYPNNTSTQTTTDSVFAWGAQVEAGSGASSYIPTGASAGSRAADVCYADNISSWYTQGIGTMLFVGRPVQSVTRNYLGFSTGTNPPRLLLYGTTATEVALYLENSTAANLVFPSGSTTLGSVNRMAASFEQAGYSCVLNGGTVGTSTTASPAMPTSGINRMNIGMRNDQFNQFYGHVVQVKYWPYRLPDAQLKSLTT